MAEIAVIVLSDGELLVVQTANGNPSYVLRSADGAWSEPQPLAATPPGVDHPNLEVTACNDAAGLAYLFGTSGLGGPLESCFLALVAPPVAGAITTNWTAVSTLPTYIILDVASFYDPNAQAVQLIATNTTNANLSACAQTPAPRGSAFDFTQWQSFPTPSGGNGENGVRAAVLSQTQVQLWGLDAAGNVTFSPNADGAWVTVASSGLGDSPLERIDVGVGPPIRRTMPPGRKPREETFYPLYLFANDANGDVWSATAYMTENDGSPDALSWTAVPLVSGTVCRHLTVVTLGGAVNVFAWLVGASSADVYLNAQYFVREGNPVILSNDHSYRIEWTGWQALGF